jgi:glycosyltransferase involved in cell wall biosynthesis
MTMDCRAQSASGAALSVIIPTYNRAGLLAKTLASLERQSLPSSAIDVVVVDDGSSDDTKSVVTSFERALSLKYIYQSDLGFRVARARNLGIKLAEAEVCVFIDSGVVVDRGGLEAHLNAHRAAAGPLALIGYVLGFSQVADASGALRELLDRHGVEAAFTELQGHAEHADIREPVYARCRDDLGSLPAPWVFFWTCNVSVDRASLLRVGAFDENYAAWGCEDVDLGYALQAAGVPIALCRDAVSLHYPHPKDGDANVRTSTINRRYLHAKYGTRATELLLTKRCMEVNDLLRAEAAAGAP